MSILSGSFAAEIADALDAADIPYELTLTRDVEQDSPAPEPGNPPNIVPVDYPFKGFVDDFDASWRAGSLIQAGDVRVIIVANSLAVEPVAGDRITARGQTFTAITVQGDPALATWQIQARV